MVFKKVSFNGGKTAFISPSWEQMSIVCFRLSRLIERSDKKYDRVVALAKGGWTWARTLVDFLDIEELDSIKVKLYEGIGKRGEQAEISQPLSAPVKGEKVLVFDDVADSGHTLKEAKEHVLELGAKVVDTATLFYKPSSIILPDYYSHETSAWIVFPHEIREFIEETGSEWMKKGVTKKALVERYKKLDLPEEQVKHFVAKL